MHIGLLSTLLEGMDGISLLLTLVLMARQEVGDSLYVWNKELLNEVLLRRSPWVVLVVGEVVIGELVDVGD